jgi:hypothetical protein
MIQHTKILSIDLAINELFSYIVRRENRILSTFFQIQNLGQGYTGPFWSKIEDVLFFFTHF